MVATRIASSLEEPAGSIRWEPCLEAQADESGVVCTECGWPVDDHADGGPARWAARAA